GILKVLHFTKCRMELVWEYLANRGLTAANAERQLDRWNTRTINRVLTDLRELTLAEPAVVASPYGFIANSQLSGAPWPCSAPDCRVNHVDSLGRFAALYADRVAVQNPFVRDEPFDSTELPWNRF